MDTLNNQYFNYRQVPVNYDGTGTINDIKGNTLVFNQLVNPKTNSAYFSFSNGMFTGTGTPANNLTLTENIIHQSGHKYLCYLITIANPNNVEFTIGANRGAPWITSAGTIGDHSIIYTSTYTMNIGWYNVGNKDLTGIKFNLYIIDLTLMFGSGNEPTTLDEFTSLFPLSYYDYNAGSLLSFNGTGIKTRPNIINGVEQGTYDGSGNPTSDSKRLRNVGGLTPIEVGKSYTLTFNKNNNLRFAIRLFSDTPSLIYDSGWKTDDFTVNTSSYSNAKYIAVVGSFISNGAITPSDVAYMYVYEDGVDTTLSLPISTYFPTGMKSAVSAYDELTKSQAIQRVSNIVFDGSNDENIVLHAHYDGTTLMHTLFRLDIPNMKIGLAEYTSGLLSNYEVKHVRDAEVYEQYTIRKRYGNAQIFIFAPSSNEDMTVEQLRTHLSSNPLYLNYELAEEVSTDITPELDLTYPVWNGGTEQILPVNTSTPTTTPILCDIDYRGLIPVNATVDPTGSGTITGTGDYRYHSNATLIATPTDEIYRFLRWEDENGQTVSTSSTFTFQVGD